MILPDRVRYLDMLLFPHVVVELADAVQMTIDRFRFQSFCHEIIDVPRDICMRYVFNRHIQPDHKMLESIQIVFNGIR